MATEKLTNKERTVLMILAKNGPKTGYDFTLGGQRERGEGASYRKAVISSGTWPKVKKRIGPEGMKLIVPVKSRSTESHDERGRRRDLYWLSTGEGLTGLVYALKLGANPLGLEFWIKELKLPNSNYDLMLVTHARVLGPHWKKEIEAFALSAESGKLHFPIIPVDRDMQEKFFAVMKKYDPSLFKEYEKALSCAGRIFSKASQVGLSAVFAELETATPTNQ